MQGWGLVQGRRKGSCGPGPGAEGRCTNAGGKGRVGPAGGADGLGYPAPDGGGRAAGPLGHRAGCRTRRVGPEGTLRSPKAGLPKTANNPFMRTDFRRFR